MLDLMLLGCAIIAAKFDSACTTQFHDLAMVDQGPTCVLLINHIHTDRLLPFPLLLLPDDCLDVLDLRIKLTQGFRQGCLGVLLSSLSLVLDRAAHLTEPQALHCLFGMSILRVATDDHGGCCLTTQGRFQQQGELRVMEWHSWHLPFACLGTLLPFIECLHTSLQGEQSLVDVVGFRDSLATLIVLSPAHSRNFFIAYVDGARIADQLVRFTLAHLL
mmetsp:Transcript_65697/g.157026  ORF Transcript_65697/g.157026 Transcript_65697/m.157026 type:complete len:218 (+) Transcript_65697:168-821(+)